MKTMELLKLLGIFDTNWEGHEAIDAHAPL